MAKLNHFIANKVGIEMDLTPVLVACIIGLFGVVVPFACIGGIPQKREVLYEPVEAEVEPEAEAEVEPEPEVEAVEADLYDDMPDLDSGEVADDEMPPGMPPLEDVCEFITKEEFDAVTLENTRAVLSKIDEYHDAMAKALDDKYNSILLNSIDDKVDHLRKELNSSIEIDIMDASIQLEEKIMKNIKEWFVPLHAKKELDKKHFQGWKGTAELESTTIQVVIKNTTYNSYEENDAWTDVTSNSDDSVKYRDSLLGLNDTGSWTYTTNNDKTTASLTKRYVTLGWNHSVNISVVINNMPIENPINEQYTKAQAADKLKRISSSIVWKRVLIPIQTNNA